MTYHDMNLTQRIADETAHQLFALLQRDYDLYRADDSRVDWLLRAEMLLERPIDGRLDDSPIASKFADMLALLMDDQDDRGWWNGNRYDPWGGLARFEDYADTAGRALAAVVDVVGSDALDIEPAIEACAEAIIEHARDTGDPARGREIIRIAQDAIADHIYL
jgi:hypothetical protein